MGKKWQRNIYWRAFEDAYTLGIAETWQRAMILIVLAVVSIGVIWLTAGPDIAQSELLNKSLSIIALVCFIFPIIYVYKLLTIPKKWVEIIIGTGENFEDYYVRVNIKNNSNTVISNGTLQITNLDPPNNVNDRFLLKRDITIAPRGDVFIDVSSYSEDGSRIMLAIPDLDGFLVPSTFGNLPVRSHTFHLKFLVLSDDADEKSCRLFVGPDRVLHLEEWANE